MRHPPRSTHGREAEPLLEIDGVWKSFQTGARGCSACVRVLRGASLVVRPGEVIGIIGERGAGKSTLLKCATGLLAPDAGAVRRHDARESSAGILLLDGLSALADGTMLREAVSLIADLTRAGGGVVIAERRDAWVVPPTRVYELRRGVLRRAAPTLRLVRGALTPASVDRLAGSL
ncbi:MAG TPA: ATP-binding cassette domain-containing protein [Gemmatimonadaceae bacterium]|nr:ATP-binding cassette domain-containing protein [Gemmatimonadaceae bacterium]